MKIQIKKILLIIIPVFLSSANLKAQNAISLMECKQKALEYNQTIKAKKAAYTSSEAAVELSKKASLPKLDLTASYLYQDDPRMMNIPGFELPTTEWTPSGVYYPGGSNNLSYHNTYNANIEMGLPIYMGGKLAQARKIAAQAMEIAESDIVLSRTDVILSIEKQYWTLVSLLEQEKVTANAVAFLSDVVEDMHNRYEVGVVTKNEILKTQVELNNAKLLQLNISNYIALAKMALNQSIGEDIQNPLAVADTVINLRSGIGLAEFSINNRPEIKMLNNQLEIFELQEKITKSDYLPQIVSFANYTFQNPNHLVQDEGELTWTAGVAMSIPLFHWGERKLKITQAKMKTESSTQNLDKTKELITLEIHQARFKLDESLTKFEFTNDALEQAKENLKLETNRLQEEVATTTELLNAQTQWQKAYADFIAAKAEVKINEVQYLKAIGQLGNEQIE